LADGFMMMSVALLLQRCASGQLPDAPSEHRVLGQRSTLTISMIEISLSI